MDEGCYNAGVVGIVGSSNGYVADKVYYYIGSNWC